MTSWRTARAPRRCASAVRVRRFRGEEVERRIPPVIRASTLLQEHLRLFRHDRQQFDRRDTKTLQIRERRRMCESRVGAAQFLRQPRRVRREPFDMQFVDDGAAPRHVRMGGVGVVLRRVTVVDCDRDRHFAKRIERVHRPPRGAFDEAVRERAFVGERGRVERHRAFDAFRVRVEEELVRVEPQAVVRVPRAVRAVSVMHAVPRLVEVQVPQAVVRAVHTEQRLAHAERFEHTCAYREPAHLFDERNRRLLVDADGLVVEAARLVDRFEDAEPQLFRGLRARDDVGTAVVGEEHAWACGVTMKFR